jgi:hypothetical protein
MTCASKEGRGGKRGVKSQLHCQTHRDPATTDGEFPFAMSFQSHCIAAVVKLFSTLSSTASLRAALDSSQLLRDRRRIVRAGSAEREREREGRASIECSEGQPCGGVASRQGHVRKQQPHGRHLRGSNVIQERCARSPDVLATSKSDCSTTGLRIRLVFKVPFSNVMCNCPSRMFCISQ